MGTSVKLLTLNCWGVPVPFFGSQLRTERFKAIADQLSKAEYDVVLLQEVFSQRDYQILCAKVLTVLPYTHYFHSGLIGSGLCIFSKYPILETQLFTYTLNGKAHKVFHGDWYAAKCVGLAKILAHGVRINVYNTHLHAEHCNKEEYYDHRLNQAFELSQFLKNTSESCDVVIAGGDFNFTAADIHYKLVVYNGNVKDAWLTQKRKIVNQDEGDSCNRPDNPFTDKALYPNGDRIDFIFYRNNTGYSMDCDTCHLAMQKIPGTDDINYSDHEGVVAEFYIRKNLTAMCPTRQSDMLEKLLLETKERITSGIHRVHSNRIFYGVSAFVCLVALVFLADGAFLGPLRHLVHPLLTLSLAILVWNTVVITKLDISALTTTKKDLEHLIKSNPG